MDGAFHVDASKVEVIAVTVTYNRKKLLEQNVRSCIRQGYEIKKLIIVDNHSTDGSRDYIMDTFQDSSLVIDYCYLDENMGGAGGFAYGMARAYENVCDAVWLMDDDGYPENGDTLGMLIQAVNENKLHGMKYMLNSAVLYDGEHLAFGLFSKEDTYEQLIDVAENNIIKGKINPFNGTLISKELIAEIGVVNKDFFIGCDEIDYQARASNANAFIATVVNSKYRHPKSKSVVKEIKILNKRIWLGVGPLWKTYYGIRNNIYMVRRDKNKAACYVRFAHYIIVILLSKCNRIQYLSMAVRAFKDGFNGRLGITVRP